MAGRLEFAFVTGSLTEMTSNNRSSVKWLRTLAVHDSADYVSMATWTLK